MALKELLIFIPSVHWGEIGHPSYRRGQLPGPNSEEATKLQKGHTTTKKTILELRDQGRGKKPLTETSTGKEDWR